MSSSYLLASVSRAIEVVNHLQQIHGESVSLLELARQTGIHKTTVLRVLRTLEHHGWVVQPAPGRYRAAIRFSGHRPHRIAYSSRDNRLAFPRAVTASVDCAVRAGQPDGRRAHRHRGARGPDGAHRGGARARQAR
jgi:biotin operon repressor